MLCSFDTSTEASALWGAFIKKAAFLMKAPLIIMIIVFFFPSLIAQPRVQCDLSTFSDGVNDAPFQCLLCIFVGYHVEIPSFQNSRTRHKNPIVAIRIVSKSVQ